MRILQTSDFHINPQYPDRLKALQRTLDIAIKEEVDSVVICGDLFDNAFSAHKLRPQVRKVFNLYNKLDIYLIPGNHDEEIYESGYVYGENVHLVNEVPFKVINYHDWSVFMVPFVEDLKFNEIMRKIDSDAQKTIIFAHGTLYDERFSFIYKELQEYAEYMPVYSWEVENRARYIGLGHFHSKMIKVNFKQTVVAYSGSPVAVDSTCTGRRKVIILKLDGQGKFSFYSKDITGVPYRERMNIHFYPHKEEVGLNILKQELEHRRDKELMLDIELNGVIDLDEKELQQEVQDLIRGNKEFFKKIEYTNNTSSFKHICSNPMVLNFMERLQERPEKDEVKDKALQLALEVFSK